MKPRPALLLALFSALVTGGCRGCGSAKVEDFVSSKHAFSVRFPCNPPEVEGPKTEETPGGTQVAYRYSCQDPETLAKWEVKVISGPLIPAEAKRNLRPRSSGRRRAETAEMMISGIPGYQYRIEESKANLKMVTVGRRVVRGETLYNVFVESRMHKDAVTDEQINEFLESFKLLGT